MPVINKNEKIKQSNPVKLSISKCNPGYSTKIEPSVNPIIQKKVG